MALPEGWTSKGLEEIFTKAQLKELGAFVKAHKNEKPYDLTNELKALMAPWKDELRKKGILSDYMAYAFANFWWTRGNEATLEGIKMARKRLGEVI
jgi:hypothetical protein